MLAGPGRNQQAVDMSHINDGVVDFDKEGTGLELMFWSLASHNFDLFRS